MAVRFVHTSDWQIGKTFGNIPGDAGALVRKQRIKTVEAIAALAREREVDFVLVAGDAFETNAIRDEMIIATVEAMARFEGAWVLLPGNHDAALADSVWSRIEHLGCPANVILACDPEPISLGCCTILPAPLKRRHESEDLTGWWDSAQSSDRDSIRIGLAHGCVENRLPGRSESLNTIAQNRSDSASLDYLALGDWHGTVQIAQETWYCGTPEPDRFKANEAGNVLVVNIGRPGAEPEVEAIRLANYSWSEVQFELNQMDDLDVLDQKLAALGEPFDRHLVRLALGGSAGLDTIFALDQLMTRWHARLLYLEEDQTNLICAASEADLNGIDPGGFVRVAVERLRAMQASGSAEGVAANDALQLLYRLQVGGGQQQ